MDDGRRDSIAEARRGPTAEVPGGRIVEAPNTPVAAPPRAQVVGLLVEGVSRETLLAAGADDVEAEPAGDGIARDLGGTHSQAPAGDDVADDQGAAVVVEDAGEAAAALLAGATVLRTHDPRPVRRAADIVALLRAIRG
jgi:hypothetical protein